MKKVLVALSGGVDSAAAVLLLKRQGYTVGGATMLLRQGGEAEAENARLAAKQMDIPFYLFDMRAEFQQQVIQPFLQIYRAGGTPNPCVICNRSMKFGLFLDKALELGYEQIATGHYARKETRHGRQVLRLAENRQKDQTYMLWSLSQRQLAHTLLPLGEIAQKEQVRALAEEAGLELAKKQDSQDICFIPDGDYPAYMAQQGMVLRAGNFITPTGEILGPHRGMEAYTIGQRRGLGMAFGERAYVLEKRGADVVVGASEALFSRRVFVEHTNYLPFEALKEPLRVQAKLRYTPKTAQALLLPGEKGCELLFDEPQRAVTIGQTAVFYDGDLLLGGGEISGCGKE